MTRLILKFLFLPLFAVLALAPIARAADLPVKAQPLPFSGIYPYGSSGLFAGIYTEGTGGSVNATVPGVPPASLTTTTAGIGLTVGYAWGQKGSALAYSLEGDFGFTNFNGSNVGLSVQGPLSFEQRFVIWAPWDKIISALNITNPFGGVPPFPALQAGVTANNLQFGIGGAIQERDISTAFLGVASNKVWMVEPKIEFLAMEQLSSGIAVRAFTKIGFTNDRVIVGAKGLTTSSLGSVDVTVGVGAYF